MDALSQLATESTNLQREINDSSGTIDLHARQLDQVNDRLVNSLRAPATEAINSIMDLSDHVLKLSSAPDEIRTKVVAKCKSVSVDANDKFEKMHTMVKSMLDEATQLATDSTYQLTTAQQRQRRIGEMQELSRATRTGQLNLLETKKNQANNAREHASMAEATRREAVRKYDRAEDARGLRFVLTFGIGELLDIGGLSRASRRAEEMENSAIANLNACNAELQQTEENIRKVESELGQLDTLDANLNGILSTLQGQVQAANGILEKTHELENNTLNAALYLSSLCGKSSALFTQNSAHRLASSVVAIESVMKTGVGLIGPLFDGSRALDGALLMIADDPLPPSVVDDMI